MNDKIVDKATQYIDAIASKLGVASEHVYGLLVKQAIVSGVLDLIFGVALIIATYVLVRMSIWLATSEKAYDNDLEPYGVFTGIGALVALIFGIVCMYSGVGELINPEYYAIKEIMDVFK